MNEELTAFKGRGKWLDDDEVLSDEQKKRIEIAIACILALVPDGRKFLMDMAFRPEPFLSAIEQLGEPGGNPKRRMDGGFQRQYMNGIAIFNPAINNNIVVMLDGDYTDAVTGQAKKKHVVFSPGGKILLISHGESAVTESGAASADIPERPVERTAT